MPPTPWQGTDTPWPLREVLKRLLDAGEHLLSDHSCDTVGHEGIRDAITYGRAYLEAPAYIYVVTAEDTGSREGERMLGVYITEADAHQRVKTFDPFSEPSEPQTWNLRQVFDQDHPESGAVHVTRYTLESSHWWEAHVIKYEVR